MAEIAGRRLSANLDETTNAALWLDKYIEKHKDDTSKKKLVTEVSENISVPQEYEKFFERWQKMLSEKCTAPPKEAEVQNRLAVGLGANSVLETSITLHRTYGTPYIPGSALKGLAAHYARNYLENWDAGSEAYQELFGTTEKSGCVDFFDALYVPKSGYQEQALWADIITVHHPDYYQGADQAPTDWDSPTPIPFLTATGKYLIALNGDKAWVKVANEILEHALYELGVGAKTSSGYGRMLLEGYEPPTEESTSKLVETINLEELLDHKGKIAKFYPHYGKGQVQDIETLTYYDFDRGALKQGTDLPRGQKIYFKVTPAGKVVEIRKRFA
jgi:CRISPR-associated protein Cmr6